jgi:hypothetical protein
MSFVFKKGLLNFKGREDVCSSLQKRLESFEQEDGGQWT